MDDRAVIRSFESGFNKRIVILTIIGIAVVLALIAFVAGGFRGRDISGGASALTKPVIGPVKVVPARPPLDPAR